MLLTGCDVNHTNKLSTTVETAGTLSQPLVESKQVEPSNFSQNNIDYSQYLKKIWVAKDWSGGAYDKPFSFFITKIENGIVEGKLSTKNIAEPDFYFYSRDSSKYLGNLEGNIKNCIAKCQFSDKVGNKGTVILMLKNNNEIEATIEYTDKSKVNNKIPLDGKYILRPYNLSDIEYFAPDKAHSFTRDLNSWGHINFVSGEVNTGDKVHPEAYLTNDENDILYHFSAAWQIGTTIKDVSIDDIDGDGLKDVKITTNFIEDADIEHIERIFYQMDNGLFYDSTLDREYLQVFGLSWHKGKV